MKLTDPPKLLVNHSIDDVDQLAKSTGWEIAFRQLDNGPLLARVTGFGHSDIQLMRIEFNHSYHQIGTPPPGLLTFGLPDRESGTLRWKGAVTPPGVLINFNYENKLDCVNQGPFGGYVFSFREETLLNRAKELGYGADLVDHISTKRFWNPEHTGHQQLRQVLSALEKVAVDDGDKGLKTWAKVFNIDIASLTLKILDRDGSSPQLMAPKFRVAAMNRAVEILGDYDQFPINIEALCTMVGASWATLQRAFAEEFGVTPSSYIKSRRLAAVQIELLKKGPDAVISDVANRWGFWHMGGFASDYRKQFGELPSQTLRRLHEKGQ